MSKQIKRVYYCESIINGKTTWKLTNNPLEAQTYQTHSLANHEDLNDWGCVGGLFPNSYLLLDEGLFEWINHTRVNIYGETEDCGEYEEVSEKEVVLDILEDMELENTSEYEIVVGYSNWRVKMFLKQFSLNFSEIINSINQFELTKMDKVNRKIVV